MTFTIDDIPCTKFTASFPRGKRFNQVAEQRINVLREEVSCLPTDILGMLSLIGNYNTQAHFYGCVITSMVHGMEVANRFARCRPETEMEQNLRSLVQFENTLYTAFALQAMTYPQLEREMSLPALHAKLASASHQRCLFAEFSVGVAYLSSTLPTAYELSTEILYRGSIKGLNHPDVPLRARLEGVLQTSTLDGLKEATHLLAVWDAGLIGLITEKGKRELS